MTNDLEPSGASGLGDWRGEWLAGALSDLRSDQFVHFVGIGGTGQHAIARVLVDAGVPVSGSDLQESEAVEDLRRRGARIGIGHDAGHAEGAGLLVVSSAVPRENPEVTWATANGVRIVKRAEFLGALTRLRRSICVAGTHGKTTISALSSVALAGSGLDPTCMVGGIVPAFGSGGRFGRGPHLVCEADEYDGSFLRFSPWLAVVSNVEPDHLDFYGSFERIEQAFREFVSNVPANGFILLCAEDQAAMSLHDYCRGTVVTYGHSDAAEWRATQVRRNELGGNDYTLIGPSGLEVVVRLAVTGMHNVLNSVAALASAVIAGADLQSAVAALAEFHGARRRFELVANVGGILIYDDYAHHPTEIRATLRGARERHDSRIWAVFQPHTVHRTKSLFGEFAQAFGDADTVLITDIYIPAGREPGPGEVTSADLVRAMSHPDARHIATFEGAASVPADEVRPGDVVLTMGAGPVFRVGQMLRTSLEHRFE